MRLMLSPVPVVRELAVKVARVPVMVPEELRFSAVPAAIESAVIETPLALVAEEVRVMAPVPEDDNAKA